MDTVINSEAATQNSGAKDDQSAGTPREFSEAVESMHAASLRPELILGSIRPPQRLAPYSHAIGIELELPDSQPLSTDAEGDAFGRLILLYNPSSDEGWGGEMRLVAYIQADMDAELAVDPMLPEVAWQWLTESLDNAGAVYTNLGGTVTSTGSVRFGDIGGPPRAYQLELRASWTPQQPLLTEHVQAFAQVISLVKGLPPEGVADISTRRTQ